MYENEEYELENINTLIAGRKVLAVSGTQHLSEKVRILVEGAGVLTFEHQPDCCEKVYLVVDDKDDFVGLRGATVIYLELAESGVKRVIKDEYGDSTETWTFLRLCTSQGPYTFRFYGSSNGYYSEAPAVFLDLSFK